VKSDSGLCGLLATNTIAQGDTREVGLEQIITDQLPQRTTIIRAVSSAPWPGVAALEVAHIWLCRGVWQGEHVLDGKSVSGITPDLSVTASVSGKPLRLAANKDKSFIGSYVLGVGLLLTPDEAQKLIEKDARNREVLWPYLNGEDLNSRPDQSPSRWVINFQDWPVERCVNENWFDADKKQQEIWFRSGRVPKDYPEVVAADFPDCLDIVERLVKPERAKNNRAVYRNRWWVFAERQVNAYSATAGFQRVLVAAQTSKHLSVSFVPNGIVFTHMTVVFAFNNGGVFALLTSTHHELWVRKYAATLETRMRYIPTDCFETFPFPKNDQQLNAIGDRYHESRRQLMMTRQEGLTKTYNRFHDSSERSEDIAELRSLHVEIDQAVAAAYGWNDLDLDHGFHETKQGVRYTISEFARRTVLDRLLALNHQRHAEEEAEKASQPFSAPAKRGGKRRRDLDKLTLDLL